MTRQSLTRVTRLFLCLGLLTLAPAVSRAAPGALPREDFKQCRPRSPKPDDDSPPVVASPFERLMQVRPEPEEPATPEEPEPAAPEPASLEMKVVDRDGRPVSGATVHAGLGDFGRYQMASTGDGGTVRLGTQPSNQPLWLLIERKGLVSEVREVVLRPGEARPMRVTLFRGVRAEGRVVDESGRPVAGAEVVLSGHLLGPELPDDRSGFLRSRETLRATTSRTGRFHFEALPEGDVTLLLQHPSYAAQREVHQVDHGDLGKIVLRRGVALSGRVVDRDGRPVADLPVRAFLPEMDFCGGAPAFSASTGTDGAFLLPHVPAGEVVLSVRRDDVRPLTEWVRPAGGPVELKVRSGAVLRGRVLDPSGRPMAGATVRPVPAIFGVWVDVDTSSCAPVSPAVTDAGGRFSVGGLRPDLYDLVASAGDRSGHALGLRAAAGTVRDGIEIRLRRGMADPSSRTTVPVRGRVTGPGGAPVGGALVTNLAGARAWTADDGSFEVQVPVRGIGITALRRGFTISEIPVNPEGAPVDGLAFRLKPESVVTGRVLGLAAGEPAPSGRVALVAPAMPEISGALAADGTFRLRGVPPGTWELSTRVAYRQAGATLTVPPGPSEVRADLHLPPTHPVSGRVLDALSRPVARAEVEAYLDNQSTRVATGADGSFHIDLPDGSYLLSAAKPGFRKDDYQKLQVQGTAVVDLQLRLEPDTSATLSGHLRGLGALERPVLIARAVRPERSPREVTADIELDAYSLTGLEPGLWSLEAQSAACTVHRTIEIPAGISQLTLDLDLAEEEAATQP